MYFVSWEKENIISDFYHTYFLGLMVYYTFPVQVMFINFLLWDYNFGLKFAAFTKKNLELRIRSKYVSWQKPIQTFYLLCLCRLVRWWNVNITAFIILKAKNNLMGNMIFYIKQYTVCIRIPVCLHHCNWNISCTKETHKCIKLRSSCWIYWYKWNISILYLLPICNSICLSSAILEADRLVSDV